MSICRFIRVVIIIQSNMKILILSIVALAVIIGSAFFLGTKSPAPVNIVPASVLNQSPEKPWIEIISGKVFEFDKNEKLIRELKTGDILEEERMVDTSTGALANIYFGDGSVLKIDSETRVELRSSQFEKTSGKLKVKIWLTIGRIYSQIKSLATLDSEWQVETPNTIAAVRGTAFGVEFAKGKSTVVATENMVEVAAKDPATNQIIEESKTILKEKEFVTVDEKNILKIKTEKKPLKVEKTSEEILNRTWIKRALEETKKTIKEIKVEENKKVEEILKAEEPQKKIETIIPKELKIINKVPTEKIFEGEKIKFEAILAFSNGSEKVVTSEVGWQVLGGIGVIEKDGTFLPKLDSSVSEFGGAFGNIIAVWKDSKTGKELLAKTPIFKVETQTPQEEIENPLEPRG